MNRSHQIFRWLAISLVVGTITTLLPAEEPPSRKEALKSFRTTCQRCHTVPDPNHKLDLAWLHQVKETA